VRGHIRQRVRDPALHKALTPDFPLGCKRILIADNFYDTLNRPNVELVTDSIASIETDAVITASGTRHAADIIVYATGFDLENYLCKTDVVGPGGVRLSELWADLPSAYKGGFIPGMPNFYMTTGPNTGVGTTSVVYMIEAQLQLILQAIEAAGRDKLIQVREEANRRYNDDIHAALQDTVWAGDCMSWYKRPDGEITTLYPYNARSYLKDHEHLQQGDFELRGIS